MSSIILKGGPGKVSFAGRGKWLLCEGIESVYIEKDRELVRGREDSNEGRMDTGGQEGGLGSEGTDLLDAGTRVKLWWAEGVLDLCVG